MPDVTSVCIVNHDTPELTSACLRSVAATTYDMPVEIIVVNNTHASFELEPLRYGTQNVTARFIQNEQPLGFAANQTRMMQMAKGQFLVALNSDTVVSRGAFQELRQFMVAHPRCGLVGPRVVHVDGSLQSTCRNFPSPFGHFLEASGLWRWMRNNRRIGNRFYLSHPHDEVMAPDWLTGVCLMTTAKVFDRVGGMQTDAPTSMFAEDLEWCWRIREAGYNVIFDPTATIVHHESASPLDSRAVKTYEGFYHFCSKHYSPETCARIRAATILALAPKMLLSRNSEVRNVYLQIMKLPVR